MYSTHNTKNIAIHTHIHQHTSLLTYIDLTQLTSSQRKMSVGNDILELTSLLTRNR